MVNNEWNRGKCTNLLTRQFDYTCSSLSPEGRLFQIEYAEKAVETSSTILGVVCKDGIIMGTEKIVSNKMMVSGTDKRLYSLSLSSGGVINGVIPDGRSVIQRGREESVQYRSQFHIPIPNAVLAERMSLRFQMNTIYNGQRPLGTSLIMASHDNMKGRQLFMVEPSGTMFQFYGCASGRGKQMARNEIEKTKFRDMTVEESLPLVAKILLKCQDEMKDKKQELEISFISESSGNKHKILDRKTVDELTSSALRDIGGEDAEMK